MTSWWTACVQEKSQRLQLGAFPGRNAATEALQRATSGRQGRVVREGKRRTLVFVPTGPAN